MAVINISCITSPPPAYSGSLAINTIAANNIVAPAGIWLEATNINNFAVSAPASVTDYDPTAHRMTYVWTVRSAPLSAFSSPQNMVPAWNNANLMYGKKVSFYFSAPGTYTVDLWAIDENGTTGVAETTIVVGNPDTLYPGNQTIYVSNDPSEDWSLATLPGAQQVTDESTLQSLLVSLGNSARPRILFKRGWEYTNINLFLDVAQLGAVGAWGVGANPILRQTESDAHLIQFWDGSNTDQFQCANIDFRGGWRADTETGKPTLAAIVFNSKNVACHYTISDNSFDGFNDQPGTIGDGVASSVIFADNRFTNFKDYGSFSGVNSDVNGRLAYIGCGIDQHVDALSGGPKIGLHNTHGPIRWADIHNVIISVCDLFSRCGWSLLGNDTAEQSCLRANSLGFAGRYLNVDRVVMEGGWRTISASGQNGGPSGTVENPGNYIFDKVLMIATAKTHTAFATLNFGGTTARNIVGIIPNVPYWYGGTDWVAPYLLTPDNPALENANAPVRLYSSTFLNNRNAANDPSSPWVLTDGYAGFTALNTDNIALHAPNIDTPVTPSAPINLASAIPGITPRYRGVRYNFVMPVGNFGANISNGQDFLIPYSNITDELISDVAGSGSPTDQTYWQAIAGVDTDHAIAVKNSGGNRLWFYSQDGDFTVGIEAGGIRITNISGATWHTGVATFNPDYAIRLDRKSLIPAMQTQYANPATLPLPTPDAGSPLLGAGDTGATPYDDFLGAVRSGPSETGNDHTGAVRPPTGADAGALQTIS